MFVDTSAWIAAVDAREPDHERVAAALRGQRRIVTTTDVLHETVTIARARLGHAAAVAIGARLQDPSHIECIHIDETLLAAGWRIFCARADKPYSLTDCTSFAAMRARGLRTAAALDDDFRREGFRTVP